MINSSSENSYINSFIVSHYLQKILSKSISINDVKKLFENKKLLNVILKNLSILDIKSFFYQVDSIRKSIVGSKFFSDPYYSVDDDPVFQLSSLLYQKTK